MIFADTSFWVAVRNRRDAHHEEATRLLELYDVGPLVTTNHVRGETWTYLRRKAGHPAAVEFLDALAHSPRIRLIFVTEELEAQATRWLRRHDEREYSFVDATTFAVMKAMRMREALAFDEGFTAAGFQELRTG